MTTTLVTITGDISNLIGTDFNARQTLVSLQANTDKIVTDSGQVRLGSATMNPRADDGTFSFPDVVASTDLVENLQYTLLIDYVDAATRAHRKKSFGPYELTVDADVSELEEVQHLEASFVSVTMTQMQALLDAQIVLSTIDDSDSAVAGLVSNGLLGPLTRAALAVSTDARTPFVELGIQAGVDPTGAAECATAIQTALDAAVALGARIHAKGTYKIATTVTVAASADLGDATFNYTGTTGTAVLIGTATSGSYIEGIQVIAPKVIATAKTVAGWAQVAGTIGLDLSNLYACTIVVPLVRSFETGMRNYGKGKGNVHNTVTIGHLDNNKINQLVASNATGWSNQNLYLGGQFSHNSGEGTAVSGTRHLEMAVCTNPVNTNFWVNPSLEGDVAEFHAIIAGSYNVLDNARWEATGGGQVKWASDSTRNEIRGGYDAESIDETFAVGAGAGNILITGLRSLIARAGGTSGVEVLENASSSANPVIQIMEAGARGAGTSPVTGYAVSIGSQKVGLKRADDAADRLILDPVNGRYYFGSGASAPTQYIGVIGSGFGIVGSPFYFAADNTYDIGLDDTTFRPRDLFLGRNAVIGGKVRAVGGLGVGNSAAATTPGTVVKKMQVFDAAGASLGYVAIYDAIT